MKRLVCFGALAAFSFLAYALSAGLTDEFDRRIREGVHAASFPLLTAAMRGITLLGWDLVAIPLAAAAGWQFAAIGRKRAGLFLFVAVAGADAILNLVKLVFQRPRPDAYFGYAASGTYSFPSGHAVLSACLYGTLAILVTAPLKAPVRRFAIRFAAALLILLIGVSRVYLGVHHASDVLAGYALAAVWLAALSAIRCWWEVPK